MTPVAPNSSGKAVSHEAVAVHVNAVAVMSGFTGPQFPVSIRS